MLRLSAIISLVVGLCGASAQDTSVSGDELDRVIQRVSSFQAQQSAIRAHFVLRVHRQNGSPIAGTMTWARSSSREKISIRWEDGDRPGDPFLNRDLYREGHQHVAHYLPNSVLISEGPVPFYPTPEDLLGFGVRKTLAEVVAEGASITGVKDGGTIQLEVFRPNAGPAGMTVNIQVREDLDYCITGWSCDDCGRSTVVEWHRDGDGTVHPAAMTYYDDHGKTPIWEFVVTAWEYSVPTLAEVVFTFKPGMLVSDSLAPDSNGQPSVFSIDATGTKQGVLLLKHKPSKSSAHPGLFGGTAGIVGLAAGLRLWLMRG